MRLGEPVPIAEIAVHIRDATLLDMRVCDIGLLQRVVISQFNVHRERDEVLVTQAWLRSGTAASETHRFDAEDIIWLRETTIKLEDVTPPRTHKPQQASDVVGSGVVGTRAGFVIGEISRVVARQAGLRRADLRAGEAVRSCLRSRQEAMWLAFEMTNLTPLQICLYFGYHSAQPLLTVREALKGAGTQPVSPAWLNRVRNCRLLVDGRLNAVYRRTELLVGWRLYL